MKQRQTVQKNYTFRFLETEINVSLHILRKRLKLRDEKETVHMIP